LEKISSRNEKAAAESSVSNEAFLVKFNKDDPENPKNSNSYYKAWLTAQMARLAFVG
jgi:hypothetical protein